MGQVLHGSARTTAAVRRAIQHSQESLRVLAKRHGINPKTVAKWKKRPSVQDERTGPKQPRSTVLTPEEEAIVVAFRRYTLFPLDDCLYAAPAHPPAPDPLKPAPVLSTCSPSLPQALSSGYAYLYLIQPLLGKSAEMSHTILAPQTRAPTLQALTYQEDLLPEMQEVLAALANLEVRIGIERECLDNWSGQETLKAYLLAELEQEYRAKREPFVVRLAELKQQIATLPLCGVNRVVH
jgi:hypothetical protein